MRHIKTAPLFFMTILLSLCLLSGCERRIDFGTIRLSEIDKIELCGTTGGKDGEFSYLLTEYECKDFVYLLNQVELGDEVDENQALSSGAAAYYTLSFYEDDAITISPGPYFNIEGTYYQFHNYEELRDQFTYFNTLAKNPISNEN